MEHSDFDPKGNDSTSTVTRGPSPSESGCELKMDSQEWVMKQEVEDFHRKNIEANLMERRLGVTWNNLTVQATSAQASVKENILSQLNLLQMLRDLRVKPPMKTIIDRSHGCVKPGEMLLVLGRPGSGCTTLLKVLANRRKGYQSVDGDVFYGSMPYTEAGQYRSQIVMNTEEELFFPTLTVNQTMRFASRLKVPHHRPNGITVQQYEDQIRNFLLASMGISHTHETKVGNEYVRGVSGGERKRVSIIECLASRASIFCWDNSTRGLDASTALDWTKAIRTMTDVLGLATIVTLYQPGNGIYELFNKVLILDEGKQIFYGPMREARPFMESLGFACRDGANTADYLTGVTVPTEREIMPGYESIFPRNADEILARYEQTETRKMMALEYDYPSGAGAAQDTEFFKQSVALEKHPGLSNTALTVSFFTQVYACVVRQYQIIWGDKPTLIIKQASNLIQALIAGSLFYDSPNTTAGLFTKGGALFFSILYNSLMALSEVTDSFTGRPVMIKHKSFGYYHPAAFCIAQIAADIPIVLFSITIFGIVIYFMVGLKATAAAFFTYWISLFVITMCLTAMFRAIGAAFKTFDAASKVSGLLISATVIYAGYMIQYPKMHGWFIWIFWIDPIAYSFETLLSNEFHGHTIDCVGSNLIPNGPGYNSTNHQSCAGVQGAVQGEVSVTGDQYLHALNYSHGHAWRNFGVVWCWWALFVLITVVATSLWHDASESGATMLTPRELMKKQGKHTADVEGQPRELKSIKEGGGEAEVDGLVRNTSVFTWRNLTYSVNTPSGDRVLLNDVHGYIKPGMLGALMGSSGAGKTTLLDVLAQRKTEGTIHGSILVDGRPLPVSFQRSAGYCEQLDVHEPYATVREALEFSALLRQPHDTPRQEKLAYVETIIKLLELEDIADMLIGKVGAGLSIEQRKRVTIGVELVAKPSVLIFLDEPTSGLDGQSAFNTVRFLRKLADAGQAILVTIHQPSAQLFAQFDTLLLLARGGKTVYFGDIGDNAATIKEYFARQGLVCPPDVNPAEFMIDVTSGHLSQGRDWNQIWLESPECALRTAELDQIITAAANNPSATDDDDGREFATPLWEQIKIVTHRMNVALFRNTDYVNNKLMLHVVLGLFNGFSFWKIGPTVAGLQLRLFTIFNFLYVSPGVISQLQPLFIDRRDIYDAREKKARMYSWISFTTGLIVSEIPYLLVSGVIYFLCWYYTVGFPQDSNKSGATLFVMLMYEFVYTGIGQCIAAYAPNAVFASLANPIFLGILVQFCGALVPYSQIQTFWRYWMYYLNPFNYVMGSLLVFGNFDSRVECAENEYAVFDPPAGQTCQSYLSDYLQDEGARTSLINPTAVTGCRVCQYQRGSDYLYTMNLKDYYYGWRDAGIVVIFAISSYALVYLMMRLRTRASKKAE
ncbi:uncharacterized protein CDV56_101606 [Aspergillus thermomutatus]|uniref:ABC transporter domain-containing protein n=1 Tax=Aspergillus thermomutatus TaxID=41047 RepID=A0A397G2T5_ASPTH|nr:uncharacterized protein CDV56_101606 [Aspergillus thermomutatus]RHZ43888.1 hypothetical protein CDV56_101606 [Aspergillus thermomutatus]